MSSATSLKSFRMARDDDEFESGKVGRQFAVHVGVAQASSGCCVEPAMKTTSESVIPARCRSDVVAAFRRLDSAPSNFNGASDGHLVGGRTQGLETGRVACRPERRSLPASPASVGRASESDDSRENFAH